MIIIMSAIELYKFLLITGFILLLMYSIDADVRIDSAGNKRRVYPGIEGGRPSQR
jgi:hypothetical protein